MTLSPSHQSLALLLGRILLAVMFIISGFNKIPGFAGTAGYMASKGLPFVEVLLVLTILIELGGGLALLLGWQARLAALIFFLWLIPVTFIFHPFWADQTQFNSFMKNLAIMGGMLYVFAAGPGGFGIDRGK